MRCRTSRISSITGSLGFGFITSSKQFQGRYQRGYEEPEHRIDAANVPDLIRVRQMPTIPRYQEVALVVRRQGQVHRITGGVRGHDPVPDVSLSSLRSECILR